MPWSKKRIIISRRYSARQLAQRKAFLYFLIAAPFIGWVLPADFLDDSKIELCPSKAFFDIECFGCGISRAVMHFHNFDFGAAIYYNELIVLVYPFLIFLWLRYVRHLYGAVR